MANSYEVPWRSVENVLKVIQVMLYDTEHTKNHTTL